MASEFVSNDIRDGVIAQLLLLPENKVSRPSTRHNPSSPNSSHLYSTVSIAEARTRSGVRATLACSCATSALPDTEAWVFTSHLSGKLAYHFLLPAPNLVTLFGV